MPAECLPILVGEGVLLRRDCCYDMIQFRYLRKQDASKRSVLLQFALVPNMHC